MDVESLRAQIYLTFARTGRPPTPADLAESRQDSLPAIQDGLQQLARERHVALDASGAIVMAHPFSAVPLGFSVMSADTLWWGGCAWDSFALPHLLGDVVPGAASVLVATRCPGCGRAHAWNVDRDGPPAGNQVAHFLVPAAHMWDDVVHTCGHQQLFCSTDCVADWLRRTDQTRGYVMDLATLWRLAAHWYDGRLTPGYKRRDPATAADYLRTVGLSGPFWGL